MFDIACSNGHIVCRKWKPKHVSQLRIQCIQRLAISCSDVECFTANIDTGSAACQKIGRDDVPDGDEVTTLVSGSKDRRYVAAQYIGDEPRDDARVGRICTLLWTEHIEVAEAYAFHSIGMPETFDVLFS